MSFMRFSAAPAGRLSDRTIPWAIFGERSDMPDGLEDNALAGSNLSGIASSPDGPMFEHASLFGAHLASTPLSCAADAPAVVFVHGFQYEPRRPIEPRIRSDNPHRCLFHFDETPDGPGSVEERRHNLTPWFARAMLHDGQGGPEDCRGLAVGYSYASRGGTQDRFLPGGATRSLLRSGVAVPWRQPAEPYVNAYRDAEQAGFGLAAVITLLRYRLDYEELRDKPIDLFCHGLGARTVLSALAMIAQRWPNDSTLSRIGRVIMLNGACYWGQAAFALANIAFADAPHRPSFYNLTCRSDEVLHYLGSRATMKIAVDEAIEDLSLDRQQIRHLRGGRTIGRNGAPPHALYEYFGEPYADWVDLALDTNRLRRWGRARGMDLRGNRRHGSGHSISFTHPGNWALYRAILNRAEGTEIDELSSALGNR